MTSFAGLTLDRPRLMGIVNVTPDSFSDGGEAYAPADAITRGRALLEAGADILDIGGESTRPGAEPVSPDQECARVLPVIEALAGDGALISIDTRHAQVMREAVAAGARIINDVSALTGDPNALMTAAALGVPVILMHMRGTPETMQDDPAYEDVVEDVSGFLAARAKACREAGIAAEDVCLDPGIGFGKTLAHNVVLLQNLDCLTKLGHPVLLGASRKSFIAALDREGDPKSRIAGSITAALKAWDLGARLFRVHDVAETRQAFAVWCAVSGESASDSTR